MNTKLENTRALDFEDMEKINSGTGMDAQLFLKHLSQKHGTKSLKEIKKHWTQEERDFFDRAYKRKVGDAPLGPYPD